MTSAKRQSQPEVESEPEIADPRPTPSISVKCRPRRLCNLISNLTKAQRADVERIGFGGLLHLKLRRYPLKYVRHFLKAFSDGSHMFRASKSKEFLITKYDVFDCFKIPLGEREMELVPTGKMPGACDDDHMELKNKWRKRFGVSSSSDYICLGNVFDEIVKKEHSNGGDEFCRLFVLLCMSSFLAPTLNNGLELKLLKAVEDVSAIPQYDWCSYVLECMAYAAEEDTNRPQCHILGCTPLLMILYFQRFDSRAQSPHDLPLIQYWDDKSLSKRLKDELDKGELGGLKFSKVQYPRCLQLGLARDDATSTKDTGKTLTMTKHVSINPPDLSNSSVNTRPGKKIKAKGTRKMKMLTKPGPINPAVPKNSSENTPPVKNLDAKDTCMSNLLTKSGSINARENTPPVKKFIQIELPPGVDDDEDLKEKALDGVHELYLKIQRNAVAFYSWYAHATTTIRTLTSSGNSSTGVVASQATQNFFEGAKVKEYVEEVQESATQFKKSVDKAPILGMPVSEKDEEVKVDCKGSAMDISLASDEDAFTSQIMETADYYNTADLNDACRREEEEEGIEGVDFTQLTDRQILEVYYSPEVVAEAIKKASEGCDKGVVEGNVKNDSVVAEKVGVAEDKNLSESVAIEVLNQNHDSEVDQVNEDAVHVSEKAEVGDDKKSSVSVALEVLNQNHASEVAQSSIPDSSVTPNLLISTAVIDNAISAADLKDAYKGVSDVASGFASGIVDGIDPSKPVGAEQLHIGCGAVEEKEISETKLHGSTAPVQADSDAAADMAIDHLQGVGKADVAVPSNEIKSPELALTIYSTADLKQVYRGVPGNVSGLVDEAGPSQPVEAVREIYVPKTDLIHHPFLLHSNKPLPCMDVVPENLGCSIDCGEPAPEQDFITPELQYNKPLFDTVFSLRKDVMDYSFNKSPALNKWEPLATYSDFIYVNREDMLTLEPGKEIMNCVIECWCILLNKLMHDNTAKVPTSRCFFGLSHTVDALDMWRAKKNGTILDKTIEICNGWDYWMSCCQDFFQLNSDMVCP